MRQIVAFLILVALFIVLVGTRFHVSDGEKLAAIARSLGNRVQAAMPPATNLTTPLNVLRRELPMSVEDRVKARLTADKRLAGLDIAVSAEGNTVKLRGVVPDVKTRRVAVSLTENTTGVEAVVDELAVPESRAGSSTQ